MGFTPLSGGGQSTGAGGGFDVRGWEVRTLADERRVGEVREVVVDGADTPRYLDVALRRGRKRVLLPVGRARPDEAEKVVWVPGMTADQLRELPAYGGDAAEVAAADEAPLGASHSRAAGEAGGGGREGATSAAAAESGRLASLGELKGFDVAEGDPDPRGWKVVDADGREIGSVHELVVDTVAMKVRYVDCEVAEESLGLDREGRHLLIPVGYVRLDEANRTVVVDAITAADVQHIPPGGEIPVARDREAERGESRQMGLHERVREGAETDTRERRE